MKTLILGLMLLFAGANAAPTKKADATAKTPAAAANTSVSLRPEAISAKTVLEKLLSSRYSHGVSTFIDQQYFTVSVQLVLDTAKKAELAPDDGLPADLMVGSLDLDEILKNDVNTQMRNNIDQFVSNYQISQVQVTLGLNPSVGDETKGKIEKWLNERVKSEFGEFGKSSVAYLLDPGAKKDFLEQLNKFQSLVGQLVLALALLIGVMLYVGGTKKSKADVNQNNEGSSSNAQHGDMAGGGGGGGGAGGEGESAVETMRREAEEVKAAKDIADYSQRLIGLVPRLNSEADSVLRLWCEAGEDGVLKLACFAEAVGGEMGKLPIPVDSFQALSKAFSRMPQVGIIEKRDILVKIYWDLMMVVNMGTDQLEKPFGYLSTMKSSMISKVLVEQNAKMKTLVTLFMPDSVRDQYVSSQDEDTKLELLRQALDLSEIATDELKTYDGKFKSSMNSGESQKDVVVIDSALLKIIHALTPIEEMTLLTQMQGPGIEQFKRNHASLAFLQEWAEDKMGLLFSRASPDEVVAYLRIVPSIQDRVLALCPPMTAEVALDEISREDKHSEAERNKILNVLAGRVKDMVERNEVSLDMMFGAVVTNIADTQPEQDEKKAA